MQATRISRSSAVGVRASAKPVAVKPAAKPVQVQQLAQAAMAFVAAATLMAAPVFAEEVDPKIKGIICAGNPTAKICLKDSAK
ncbi:hypothetical protein QJQ45_013855 [Haematococcus lacustris]|nr:hypothetical protein QJQ45_007975 [Haematococcus lacustris]KAJ9529503.1 hypothetical protein QJQ45_013855 [Haematococcus lacustris]